MLSHMLIYVRASRRVLTLTIALFSFAIMMTILIIHLQRKPSHNSETASQVNA